nr:Mu transposase C-terminal domain-containing protein [Kordiimonas marina]
MRAREGALAADRYFRCSGAGIVAEAPLDYVLIDHTEVDLETVPGGSLYVARPTLTVALDLYSRMPWGVYLGFAAPGYESLMMCLRNGIMHKGEFLAEFSSIEGTWPCHGLPRKIILDNGLEFHSESLRDVCGTFGISIIHNPVRTPQYKGAVERFFRTLNDGFLSGLQGRTFSNIVKKGDYDPVSRAAIQFADFKEALFKWIVDVYARKFHRGIEGFPIEFWQQGVSRQPVDLPVNVEDLKITLGEAETRTLRNSGIFIHNARYNCTELGDLFRRFGKPRKVKVKVDPLDLGMIHVFDEQRERFISVSCTDSNLYGVGKWQYQLIRKEIAAHRMAGESTYDIQRHLKRIYEMLSAKQDGVKRKSNKRAARHAEYQNRTRERGDPKGHSAGPPDFDEVDTQELLGLAARSGWGKSGFWE